MSGTEIKPVHSLLNASLDSPHIGTITVKRLSVSFGGVAVLRDLTLSFSAGRTYGLLGQNGSGKSTFIKALAGAVQPLPGGRLRVDGKVYSLPLPADAPTRLGFGFVHQHLPLADDLPVFEHLTVGRYEMRGGRISWRHERRRAAAILERCQIDIPLNALVRTLTPGQRALLSVAAAIGRAEAYGNSRLLVLDEVTTYLNASDVDKVLALANTFAQNGMTVVIVSHRLKEIFQVADEVVVLRDGQVSLSAPVHSLSEAEVVTAIVGEEVAFGEPDRAQVRSASTRGRRQLRVEGAAVRGIGPLTFSIRGGEVVGLTGLQGSGYDQIPYLIYGAFDGAEGAKGRLTMEDASWDLAEANPADSIRRGVVLVPRDRLKMGAVASASITENYTLPRLSEFFCRGLLRSRNEQRAAANMVERLGVVTFGVRQSLGTLSGGNQQRVVIGKWIDTRPRVLLLDEPTQGVDVGGRADIWTMIRAQADAGLIVLVCSEVAEELAEHCDRVIVMRDGIVTKVLENDLISEQHIVASQHGII